MKQRKPHPRMLCCASIFALSLAACTHQSGHLKSDARLADDGGKDSSDQLFKVAKKGQRAKKPGGSLPDPRSYDNLWDRLFDRFDLPDISHQDIDRELNWFINHPAYIERVQSRAEPFLYSIVKQLERHHLPGELALLPVIESAFQPHAVSPANAAGIWQFVPATGRHYGLKQSHSYDGRRDIYASTRAAIKYLKKLHNDFNGDWLLAIAAYNCGEGAVSRAIQKNVARGLPTDFWSLDLPQETRSYVPRLLAVAKLFSDSEQYGISLRPIPNKALYKVVKMNTQVDLALAANAAEISLDKLFELNPGFKRQQVDLDGTYRLFIPAHKKIVDFKEELARQISGQASYDQVAQTNLAPADAGSVPVTGVADAQTPAPAENVSAYVSKVAETAPTPASEPLPAPAAGDDAASVTPPDSGLQLAENASMDSSFDPRPSLAVYESSAPRVYEERSPVRPKHNAAKRSRTEPVSVQPQPVETDNSGKKVRYVVRPGDTLFSIARKYDMDVQELRKMNHLSHADDIKYGQALAVWSADAAKKFPIAKTGAGFKPIQSLRYTVREGETLFAISKRFNVTVGDLRKWNGIKADRQFRAGMNITLSGGKD